MIELSTRRDTEEKERLRAAIALDHLLARTDLGFFQLHQRDELWSVSQRRGQELKDKCTQLVVVGIGGSALGAKALAQALSFSDARIRFLDNVDGLYLQNFLSELEDLQRVHWLLVSKSGGTLETLTLADFIGQFLSTRGVSLSDQATVISELKDSPLTLWARQKGVEILPIPEDVGGRFSVLTPVGLLPASFLGHDLAAYRRGMEWVLTHKEQVVELSAQTLMSWQNGEWLTPFWVYSSHLLEFSRWIQQLWAESLAKKKDRRGEVGPRVSVPLPLLGSTDQHSVLQQLSEGAEAKFIWFFRVGAAETCGPPLASGEFAAKTMMQGRPLGELLATFAESTGQSLAEQGTSSLCLKVDELSESSLAALMTTMMLVVGTLGECLDIHAFDQPGVELGKRLALQRLQTRSS